MRLVAQVDEATARTLRKPLKGSLTATGREDIALTATLENVATLPALDGKYRINLTPEWPENEKLEFPADLDVAAGMNFECRFIVHHDDEVITLPAKALQPGEGGTWTVQVKTADGKGSARTVTRGRISGDKVEITSGLENGQVIVVPD